MHCGQEFHHRVVAPLCTGATLLTLLVSLLGAARPAEAQRLVIHADHADGIYQSGEEVHWQVQWEGAMPAPATCHYVLKKGGLTVLKEDNLALQNGVGSVAARFTEPQSLLLEVKAKTADGREIRGVGGAIAGWQRIPPSAPRPKDFDAFWKAKINELRAVPANPQLESADAGKPGVHYWKITLDNIHGTHIQGQLARPAIGAKFPALLIVQWAGVYGLSKSWVTDRAAEGWLVLNIEAHDLPIDRPEAFYQEQNAGALRNYPAMGNDSRETSYFLRMYLGDYRAAQYLAERPDWDGRTLVVMGGSQGGQQTLITAGLHPKITAALAEVPAGCDMLGPDSGRAPGWPMWYWQTTDKDPQKVHEASRYFDAVNFASRIHCPILVGAGLIDETCPPAGVAAAVNQIRAPKELIFFPQGGHQDENHSHSAYSQRCWGDWLPALLHGKPAPLPTQTAPSGK
jgi:cephalosporin-C deacetylase